MKFLGGFLVFFTTLYSVCAAESTNSFPEWSANFEKGMKEFSAGVGVFFSPFGATEGRPTLNYGGASGQIGYMLNHPNVGQEWRGNFEVLAELSGAGIFKGRGNYVASTTLWLRYNLLPPRWNLVPYIQGGAGVTLTDANQKVFGQVLNFNTDAAFGIRYFINSECSINAEYRFQHISNAGMAERNLGINAQGAWLSASWFF